MQLSVVTVTGAVAQQIGGSSPADRRDPLQLRGTPSSYEGVAQQIRGTPSGFRSAPAPSSTPDHRPPPWPNYAWVRVRVGVGVGVGVRVRVRVGVGVRVGVRVRSR